MQKIILLLLVACVIFLILPGVMENMHVPQESYLVATPIYADEYILDADIDEISSVLESTNVELLTSYELTIEDSLYTYVSGKYSVPLLFIDEDMFLGLSDYILLEASHVAAEIRLSQGLPDEFGVPIDQNYVDSIESMMSFFYEPFAAAGVEKVEEPQQIGFAEHVLDGFFRQDPSERVVYGC